MSDFLSAIGEVRWSLLEGCYGASTGPDGDVAGALRDLWTKTRARPSEEDDRDEALAVLCSHVFHQGDVFPVTAPAIPFLLRLIERGDPMQRELASLVIEIADCATDGPYSEEIAGAIRDEAPRLTGWFAGGEPTLTYCALSLARLAPNLREAMFAALAERWPAAVFISLLLEEEAQRDETIEERASSALASEDLPTRTAAAAWLASQPDRSGSRSEALRPFLHDEALEQISMPNVHTGPLVIRRPWMDNEPKRKTIEAEVILCDEFMIVYRCLGRDDHQRVRWAGPVLEEGSRILLHVTSGEPIRQLTYVAKDGTKTELDVALPPMRLGGHTARVRWG